MVIRVLAENTSGVRELGSEHGLSLYVETRRHRLLFDTGASALFAENAAKMGIDLAKIDTVVISHGHIDHGGGLKTFMGLNGEAKIYLSVKAFDGHYSARPGGEKAYIGLDKALLPDGRFVFVGERHAVDDELEMFSSAAGQQGPAADRNLFALSGNEFVPDDFSHEQNLILREGDKSVLLTGCAHTGVVGIVGRFRAMTGRWPDCVIGGFHLYRLAEDSDGSSAVIREIGERLAGTGARFFTCHCTGLEPYAMLKRTMGDSLGYLSTGNQITI